jgi:hypothetical protein
VVRIFQIDGKYNPKISSIKLQDLPVYSADFSADGKQILMTGRKSFFYFHDLSLDKVQKVNKIVGIVFLKKAVWKKVWKKWSYLPVADLWLFWGGMATLF